MKTNMLSWSRRFSFFQSSVFPTSLTFLPTPVLCQLNCYLSSSDSLLCLHTCTASLSLALPSSLFRPCFLVFPPSPVFLRLPPPAPPVQPVVQSLLSHLLLFFCFPDASSCLPVLFVAVTKNKTSSTSLPASPSLPRCDRMQSFTNNGFTKV